MPLFQRTIKLTLATCLAAAPCLCSGLDLCHLSWRHCHLEYLGYTSQYHQAGPISALCRPCWPLLSEVSPFPFWIQPLGTGVFIALYVPCAFLLGWQIGITPSTVLVTHLLIEQSTSWGSCSMNLPLFNRDQLCLAGQSLYAF